MAAVLERHPLVYGADHLGQAVPRCKPDEPRARFWLLEPPVQVGKKYGNVAIRSRPQHLLVAEVELGVAAAAAGVGAAE